MLAKLRITLFGTRLLRHQRFYDPQEELNEICRLVYPSSEEKERDDKSVPCPPPRSSPEGVILQAVTDDSLLVAVSRVVSERERLRGGGSSVPSRAAVTRQEHGKGQGRRREKLWRMRLHNGDRHRFCCTARGPISTTATARLIHSSIENSLHIS